VNAPRLKHEHTPEQWEDKLRRGREIQRRYRNNPDNVERIREQQKQHRQRPGMKEKRRAYWKQYVEKNRDKMRAKWLLESAMTPELFERLMLIQGKACAVCKRLFSAEVIARSDHCHDSNKPRGILCFQCNVIEGIVKRMSVKPSDLGNALELYLANPPAKGLEQ